MSLAVKKIYVLLTCSVIILLGSCVPEGSTRRVEDIIRKMPLREKVELIGGYKNFNIRPFEQYGIPEIRMADGPLGVRNYGASTAYPASIALAASWDKELAAEIGASIAMEARSRNVHIMLGPAMNIHRAPYCGRNFEYLGEDPFLAGELAASYIASMQKLGVVATAKHYAANYQDYDRHNVSSDMDERTLHEIYLPAFKASVIKGNAGAVMTSYNPVNGIHASEHDYLINQVLKTKWNFKGIVMSDWTSTYNGVACAKGGLDIEMPSGVFMHPDTLLPAIKNGLLSEKIIDDKVRRILNLYERFDFFDNPDLSSNYTYDEGHVRKVALDAARGGITLLKNENGLLPVTRTSPLKIAVIGMNAHPAVTGGGGSSYTEPLYPVSLLDAMKKVSPAGIEVVYAQALPMELTLPMEFYEKSEFYYIEDGIKHPGVRVSFFNNVNLEGQPVFDSVFNNINHDFNDHIFPQVPEVNYAARFEGKFLAKTTGNYRIAISGDDGYRVYLNGEIIIDHWQNQPETMRSFVAKLRAGQENDFVVEYYQGGGHASIRFGYRAEPVNRDAQLWAEAVKAARTSDYVIFSVGFTKNTETEGSDRTWELPFKQDQMILELAPLNKNSIVVVNAGGNISMPWLRDINSLIYAWYPGQEGNIAVAEIIYGIINPSGKLPVSFEEKPEDNATYNSYRDDDGDKRVYFDEGIFMGYRHFDRADVKPRFPFGYGLSFTTFEYNDLTVDKLKFKRKDSIQVTFTVKNTGDMDGAEISQVYVSDLISELPRPVKELKGFDKVLLSKGEQKELTITLGPDAFSYYNEKRGGWISEPGEFEILVGSSSEDIRLRAKIELTK